MTRPSWLSWTSGLVVAACAVGAGLRLARYLKVQPLFLDEAMLALNIAAHPAGELLGKHDYHQVAPPLFLLIARAAIAVGGVDELSLRAFSVIAGIAVLPLMYVAARKLLGRTEALLAVWTGALSAPMIRYSPELKPYSVDALVTVSLVLALALVLERPDLRSRWAWLALSGILAPMLSIAAAFVIGAVLLSLLASREHRSALPRVLTLGAVWFAVGLAVYLLSYHSTAANDFQHQGYAGAFLVPGEAFLSRLDLGVRNTLLLGLSIRAPEALPTVAAALLAVCGVVLVVRRHGWRAAIVLSAPILFAALASSVRRYPFGVPKMMVFSVPLVLLTASVLVVEVGRAMPRLGRFAFFAVVGGALVAQGHRLVSSSFHLPRRQDTPALLEDFRQRPYYNEPVYVGARGMPAWLFYTTRWEDPDRERLRFYADAGTWGASFENAPSRGRPVETEGFDLVYQYRQRKELLGVSTGRQWRHPSWFGAQPDEGWARNEAERIVLEANPCFWMFFSQISELAHKRLMWELRDHYFAEQHYQRYAMGTVLWRYCLPTWGEKAQWLRSEREAIRQRVRAAVAD